MSGTDRIFFGYFKKYFRQQRDQHACLHFVCLFRVIGWRIQLVFCYTNMRRSLCIDVLVLVLLVPLQQRGLGKVSVAFRLAVKSTGPKHMSTTCVTLALQRTIGWPACPTRSEQAIHLHILPWYGPRLWRCCRLRSAGQGDRYRTASASSSCC